MNPIAVAFAVAGLAVLAGAGVVAGFLREAPAPVEPLADPLEDRREALLRSLADLEDARASGALDEAGYLRFREQTQGRMVRVLRALDRRDAAASAGIEASTDRASGEELEGQAEGRGVRAASAEPRRVPAWAVAVLIGGTVLAVVVASLAHDAEPQTQAASSPQAADDPLAFFEQRVQEQPNDLAARLDLAHRYLDAGMISESLSQIAFFAWDRRHAMVSSRCAAITSAQFRSRAARLPFPRRRARESTAPSLVSEARWQRFPVS